RTDPFAAPGALQEVGPRRDPPPRGRGGRLRAPPGPARLEGEMSVDGERRAVRWRVRGRVQGVGFRWYTREVARVFGDGRIVGKVRNLPDGSVEIEAAGRAEDLALFEEEIRKG